jgi:hypothetical protein
MDEGWYGGASGASWNYPTKVSRPRRSCLPHFSGMDVPTTQASALPQIQQRMSHAVGSSELGVWA